MPHERLKPAKSVTDGAKPALLTGRLLAKSLMWATSGRLAGQAVSWLATLWVVRLLTPADYGLMAMGMVVIAGLQLFEEIGLGTVLVQTPALTAITVRKALGFIIVVATLLCTALMFAAPLIARFYKHADLTPILYVLALLFLTSPWIVVPRSLLERRFEFKRIALADALGALAGALTTLVFALNGKGVWALVFGALALSVTKAATLSFAAPPFGMPIFSLQGLGSYLRFGARVTLERILWFAYYQADVLIAGKALGSHAAGLYIIGKELAALPAQKLAPNLQQVALPTFSRMESCHEIGRSLTRGIGIVSFVAFPIFFGLAAVAPDLVPVLLGPQWESAAIALRGYSLVMPLALINGLILAALKASGQPGQSLANVALGSVIMLTALAIGSHWGLVGLSLAWVIAFPIYFTVSLARATTLLFTRAGELARGIGGPLAASMIMLLLVTELREMPIGLIPQAGRLAMLVVVGACFYGLAVFTTQRVRLLEIFELIRPRKPQR